MRKLILPILVIFLTALLLTGCHRKEERKVGHLPAETGFVHSDISAEGRTLPDFVLTDLRNGKEIDRQTFKGKVMLIAFVTSWCPLCREEMLHLQKLEKDYPAKDFAVLGLIPDAQDQKQMREVADMIKLDYPMAVVGEELRTALGPEFNVPVAFLIDRHGLVRKKYLNHLNIPVLKEDIAQLLKR